MWSGAARSTPINDKTDRKKPSAWRKGNRKTRRSVNAVSIAQSENVFGAPGRPDGDGRHASVASAESHSVTSPRWTKACSYADHFPTRYFVLYFGWTFDLHRLEIVHPQRSPWPESLQLPRRSRRVVHQRVCRESPVKGDKMP